MLANRLRKCSDNVAILQSNIDLFVLANRLRKGCDMGAKLQGVGLIININRKLFLIEAVL